MAYLWDTTILFDPVHFDKDSGSIAFNLFNRDQHLFGYNVMFALLIPIFDSSKDRALKITYSLHRPDPFIPTYHSSIYNDV